MTQIATLEQHKDFEVLVDPKEFGIETGDDKRVLITGVFAFYEKEYNEIISATEITTELSEKASSLRKKVGKIRIGISKIHKAKKEYWLNGGRSVDAWKNDNSAIVEEKERKLQEIETHFQRIEQERISKMREARIEILKQYDVDGTLIPTIAIMDETVWESFLMGERLKFEAKKEQERIAEEQRIAKEKADAEEREKMRLENERLRSEAKKREAELEMERKKQAEILAKQKAESDAKLKAEREEKAKIESELKAKQDAEAKAKADEDARVDAEANMGDKQKVEALIEDLIQIKSKYQFKSKKNQKMFSDVQGLIDKVISHIKK